MPFPLQYDAEPLPTSLRFDPQLAHELIESYLASRQNGSDDSGDRLGEALEAIRPLANSIIYFYADELDREDIAQEALIHLIAALPTYDHDTSRLKPWLSSIIRRKTISLWRERAAHAPDADGAVSLDEALSEFADDAYDDDPESALPLVAVLRQWFSVRFPSLDEGDADRMAEFIALSLADGTYAKTTLRGLRELVPHLPGTTVAAICFSAIIFFRSLGWSPAYDVQLSDKAAEFTLYPEIQLYCGPALARKLYALFRGVQVHFKVR